LPKFVGVNLFYREWIKKDFPSYFNLLSSALKFTTDGSISIISEKKDGQAIVRIKDTGTGIDSELFPKLFSKFASKSF
jgi:signal transduction histidine kinase